jgi:hypothetical protein
VVVAAAVVLMDRVLVLALALLVAAAVDMSPSLLQAPLLVIHTQLALVALVARLV